MTKEDVKNENGAAKKPAAKKQKKVVAKKKAAPKKKKVVVKKKSPKKVSAKSKTNTTAKNVDSKTKTAAAKKAQEAANKNKALEAVDNFRRVALGNRWSMNNLINKARDTFGEDVKVDKFNNAQVAFSIGKIRIPEKGYFTVN